MLCEDVSWTFNIVFANVLLLEMFVHLENNFSCVSLWWMSYRMSSVAPGAWFDEDFIRGAQCKPHLCDGLRGYCMQVGESSSITSCSTVMSKACFEDTEGQVRNVRELTSSVMVKAD